MQLRKKILSHFLLAIYLLVVLHLSVMHSHNAELSKTPNSVSHQHENFKEIHHEHGFHVGIFHLLGHLFEGVNHSNDHADEHLVIAQKASSKKNVDLNKTVSFLNSGENKVVVSVDAESLPDPPPYHLFLSHRLKQPNTPLRAPPALV
ncbi:MAG: hypothetical protein ACRBG0_10645 [Lewinella sp.]|uniref:hypothetical protein n=1 Tax=Lewinella sp. TaxID=2004506 RepID=UPI003D6B3E17